jgi:hypothetical protein
VREAPDWIRRELRNYDDALDIAYVPKTREWEVTRKLDNGFKRPVLRTVQNEPDRRILMRLWEKDGHKQYRDWKHMTDSVVRHNDEVDERDKRESQEKMSDAAKDAKWVLNRQSWSGFNERKVAGTEDKAQAE